MVDFDALPAAARAQLAATRMPVRVDAMAATLTSDRFSDPDWIYERKLDGERCLAFADDSGVRLMTRNQHEITNTFPEIAGALASQGHEPCVVDGEIVWERPP